MFRSEQLQEKWGPVLDHSDLPQIVDKYKKAVTSVLLENQEKFLAEERGMITEAAPTMSAGVTGTGFSGTATATGPAAGFDPVLISLIRRSMPQLIAYDICGVQLHDWSYRSDLRNAFTLRHQPYCWYRSILQRSRFRVRIRERR